MKSYLTLAAIAVFLTGCVGAELSLVLKRDAVAPMTYQGCTTETVAEGGDSVTTENCVTTWGDPFVIRGDVLSDTITDVVPGDGVTDIVPSIPFVVDPGVPAK